MASEYDYRFLDRRASPDIVLNCDFDNGSARDLSWNAKNGTLTNGAAITAGNRFVTLDGVDDYVNHGDADAFSFTNGSGTDLPFSISCWLYQTSDPGGTAVEIVSKYSNSANVEWIFSARYDASGPRFACYKNGSYSVSIARLGAGVSIGLNSWVHWCGTYSGSKTNAGLKIFKNGVQVDNTNSGEGTYTGMSNTAGLLRIGKSTTGHIDGPQIYSRELSAAEVAAIYAAGRS